MRPGALERLGIGPTNLRPDNPKLVFASISGYGATGRDRLHLLHERKVYGIAFLRPIRRA